MTSHRPHCHRRLTLAVRVLFSLAAVGWLGFSWATAAEPEFVGVLALAVEDDVVTQLGLTDAQKDALLKLIETRENVDALELALQLQDVPAAQRHEKMAPFRRQSELKGLALLTPEQRQKLEQIRIQRVGLATLAEPAIAEKLQLTDPQRAQVAQLLRQGGERLAAAEEKSVHVIRAEVERSLRSVLSDEQWAAWQRLAFAPSQAASLPGEGLAAAEAPPPPPPLELVMNEPAAPAEAEPAPPGEPKTESSDLPETEPAEPSETQPVQAAETAAPERVSTEPSQPVQPPPSDSPGAQPTDAPAPESAGPAEMPPAETSDVGPPAPSAPGLAEPAQPPSPEPSGVQPAGPPETAPVVPPGAEAVMPPGAEAVMPPGAEAVAPPGAEAVAPPGAAPVAPPGAEVPKPSPSEELDWLRLLDTELAAREAEGPVRLRFNFRYQPWEDVLDWVAEQAGLSLLYEDMPKGTCNYVDNREYTVPEALDVLNSLLLIKGYTLVRRERMLVVVNLDEFEDGIPPNLVTMVPVDELDERGEYELVSTVFQLEKITAEEAQAEIEKLLGPQGKIVPLPKAQQIVVTETAGRLRTIRDALQRVEDPEGLSSHQFRSFPLEFTMAEEVLAILRQLFDIPADQNAAPDGSIRLILDPLGMRLIAFGKPSKLEQVAKVLEAIEGPGLGEMETPGVEAALQLEVYNVGPADSQSVLKVIQTLLAGSPGARLSIDEKTGNLIALCRPEDHATIRATMEQLINDASAVDVIQLRSLDPQVAVLSITKLFGGEGSTLKVDADPTTRRLVVRGPKALVEQIRAWLEKMGESEVAEAGVTTGGNVRVLPLSGWAGKSALERLQEIWPTMRQNKIRVVAPGAAIPEMRVSRPGETPAPEMDRLEQLFGLPPLPGQSGIREPASQQLNPQYPSEMPLLEMDLLKQLFGLPPMPEQPEIREPASQQFIPQYPGVMPPPEQVPAEPPETLSPAESPSAGAADAAAKPARVAAPDAAGRGRFMFASDMVAAEPGSEGSTTPQAGAASGESETEQAAPQATPPQPAKEPAPIIVAPGPGGIMIASEDVEALNEFESLLTALASVPMAGTADMTVFYLVHARATLVAEILDAVFGGGTLADGDGSSGRGSLLGDLAGAAFGDAGNLVGSLLGLGGGGSTITASGSIQIIPVSDTRLNALIVRANPTDTETVRQLLEILDQERSPVEVLAQAKPRLIPVSNTLADEMAEVVRQIYQANLSAGSGGGRPPSPQEFLEALRGGRGRGRSSRSATEEVQRMSIGVDARTNSLIVSAPEPLFQEVKLLVETLDQAALGSSNQAVQVVTLKRSNAEAVQKALSSLVGENVTFGRSGSRTSSTSGRPSGPTPPSPGSPMDEFRRQMIMRAMQGGGGPPGFGGGPSPFGGGGGPPGFGGGGFSRAGFGPPGGFGRGGSSRGGGSSGGGRR